ncbi:MAG: AraC family transcriptional regulator [Bryobacterales bacterium]|nr:AraC family transcriptional regulator [Bryobacterales bacterium]
MQLGSRVRWEDAYSIIEPQINADSVHVWPFPPGFPVDVGFLRFGPPGEIRMNRHDYFEVLFVSSGEVVYQVQDQYVSLHPGDLFLIGSTLLHRMSRYGARGVKAAVLYFLPDLVMGGDHAVEQMEYLMPFLVQDAGFPHAVQAATGIPAQVFDLMKRAEAELPAASSRARLSVKTYLKMILVLLVNHYAAYRGEEDAFERRQKDLDRLKPLFDLIDQLYHEPLGIEDASSLLHMSKSNFMRFFKQVTGQSFVGYLNRFRVAKAEILLAETDLSIAEVSQRTGFCDQSYFGLVFRNVLQMTPREYKHRLGHPRSERERLRG